MTVKPHKNLEAWKKAIELTVKTYRLTETLPTDERFSLTAQMRRAAISIARNIAEGAAKDTRKEFIRYLHTARASLSELDTQAVICKELGYLSAKALDPLGEEFERESKLITGLIKFLRKAN